jgi:hypothetical protein
MLKQSVLLGETKTPADRPASYWRTSGGAQVAGSLGLYVQNKDAPPAAETGRRGKSGLSGSDLPRLRGPDPT